MIKYKIIFIVIISLITKYVQNFFNAHLDVLNVDLVLPTF